MGKNTLMRKAIRLNNDKHPEWASLVPFLKGNVGLVFSNGDLYEVKNLLTSQRVSATAKVGTYAPQDVWIPKGGTGLEPTKTSFLQALNIASKINRGQVEILQDVLLIKNGEKIGTSEAFFLQMLDIKPFSYGLICNNIYEDGKVYLSKYIDIPTKEVLQKFAGGISTIAAISLAIGLPTIASVPHAILNGYKNLLAVVIETNYGFDRATKVKEMVENPDAFVVKVEAVKVVEEKPEEAPVEDEPEPDKEESDDMGFNFFDEDEQ
jgi:large subunit ribosomal protein LP0